MHRRALGQAGLADFGTRLKAVFNSIPNGVSVFVSTNNVLDTASPTAKASLTAGDFSPFSAVKEDLPGLARLSVVNGSASAVWEVINSDPKAKENFDFAVVFSYAQNAPTPGTATVQGGYPIPRFFATGTSTTALPVSICRVNLLYPFVTNTPCFDTGLAISSTSTDPFGTEPQSGVVTIQACSGTPTMQASVSAVTLNYYGANAPQSMNTINSNFVVFNPNAVPVIPTIGATDSSTPKSNQAQSAWLTANTNSSAGFGTTTTPITATVSANPAGLVDGSYSGTVSFITASPGVAPLNVPVALTVQSKLPQFSAFGVANIWSYASSVVAPGEAVVIFGSQYGPPALAGLSLTNNKVDTLIGDTRVLFDGVPAPMLYAFNSGVPGQALASCFVPFSVAGKFTTQVQVEYKGVKSPPITVAVVDAVPALLSLDLSGGGQGGIRNANQTINSSSNPAHAGELITLYGVGSGQTNPPGQDGALYSPPYPVSVLPIRAFLDGKEITPQYAGPAGGAVQGLFQVNIFLPADVRHGDIPVYVMVGNARSQPGITIAVQ